MAELCLRRATHAESDAIWSILEPILRVGEPYALPDNWSREQALAYRLQASHHVFAAEREGTVLGTYTCALTSSAMGIM